MKNILRTLLGIALLALLNGCGSTQHIAAENYQYGDSLYHRQQINMLYLDIQRLKGN